VEKVEKVNILIFFAPLFIKVEKVEKVEMTSKELNYSLHNSENYKKELDADISEVVEKLSKIFIEYYKFIRENLKVKKRDYSIFIINRGLDTIINVFNYILFYTKNLDITYFHCQKSFYFYVEFVGQISEDEKMFLQLTSRDATTYVYKKTIFDINGESKKNNEQISDYTKLKLDIINSYVNLYKTYLYKIVKGFDDGEKCVNILEKIYNKLNNIKDMTHIQDLADVTDTLFHRIDDVYKFFEISNVVVKKFSKNMKSSSYSSYISKILSEEFETNLANETP
jgi:hypothetical protein